MSPVLQYAQADHNQKQHLDTEMSRKYMNIQMQMIPKAGINLEGICFFGLVRLFMAAESSRGTDEWIPLVVISLGGDQ